MHRLHERDVRVDGLLVRGDRVRNERHGTHGCLHRVEQRQSGEHPHRHQLLFRRERRPRLHVVREWNLLGQPEVVDEAVPHLDVLLVLDAVPVDRLDAIGQFEVCGSHEILISRSKAAGSERSRACS